MKTIHYYNNKTFQPSPSYKTETTQIDSKVERLYIVKYTNYYQKQYINETKLVLQL